MSKIRILVVFLVSILFIQPPLLAQTEALEGFDEFVEGVMTEWKIPGLAVAITQNGEVMLAKGYGYRNVETQLPATQDTLFAIGSNTKSFTASLLGMLADDGKLDWDTPVREYMPDFRLYDRDATEQMTARDLVRHNSGLPRHDLLWYASGRSRHDLYSRLRYLEPTKPFRTTFQYQNLMFMTAGILAERITERTWEDNIRMRIFDPLGMERSNLSVSDMEKDSNYASPYMEIEDKVVRVPFRNIDAVGPAGSINSSVVEMIRYVQWHMNFGKHGEAQLLSEKNAHLMQTPQMIIGGSRAARMRAGEEIGDPSYGLGLMASTYRGRRHVLHGGGIDGFISAMEWLPQDGIGVVVLSNFSGNNPVPGLVVRNAFDRLLGMEPIDWAERTRKRQAEAEKQQEEAKAKASSDQKQGTSPTHVLADYAGEYEHPGYGIATVTVDGDKMTCEVVGFSVPLRHYHYDIFEVPDELPPPAGNMSGTKVTFFYNKKGDIDRLAIPLESSIDDIVFTRVKEKSPGDNTE